ncbi:MAG: hypothetical protein KDK70_28605 [Myxococcales bacterium]|nr:hypothetical protein [Myxococcales bacterium]
MTTLCLTVACGPTVPEVGSSDGSGDSTTSGTTDPNPTNPNPTQPDPDTGVMTGDATSSPTTGPTSGPDDTTGDPPGSNNCCDVAPTPGCNDPAVVDCVCKVEAFCCAFEWDANCVDVAVNMCDATCEDPGTTGDPGTTTGPMGGACEDLVTFEMLPSEATYSGDWELGMSMIGEGEISVLPGFGTDGSILYEPDIPCDDTWYIWVRYWEQGSNDSYFATLDGQPMPEAIFEGDCTGGGQGYNWRVLNWRDQGDPACTYLEDPWAPDWAAGVHQVEFSYRESQAMGRILFTNDPDYVPM